MCCYKYINSTSNNNTNLDKSILRHLLSFRVISYNTSYSYYKKRERHNIKAYK